MTEASKPKRYPHFRKGDSAAMREAIVALVDRKIYVERPSEHQLRTRRGISFYPTTGTIMPDGRPPLKEKGLDALIRYLCPAERRPRLVSNNGDSGPSEMIVM